MFSITCFSNGKELDIAAADVFSEQLRQKPSSVLGLATGSTPEGLYALLSEKCARGEISFRDAETFNLDEYAGLSPDDPNSYGFYMRDKLFSHTDINPNKTHLPGKGDENGAYDAKIAAAGGIDLQLLGIGRNGHIGFNEPGTPFESTTHMAELTESTRAANSRFFASLSDVPEYAVTMGLSTIMQAKKILLLIKGQEKFRAFAAAYLDAPSPCVPASVLQLHNDVEVFISS